jgi:hypothetical protein
MAVDRHACDTEVAFGKKNVLDALDLLEDEAFPGVVGVIDADFDRLLGVVYGLENLCVTDQHDLDLVLFSSSALDRYIAEHADAKLYKAECGSDTRTLRLRVMETCKPIAYYRLVSEQRSLNLYFKDLKHEDFVNVNDLTMDANALLASVISRSRTQCTSAFIKKLVAVEAAKGHNLGQLVSGHDAAAVLGIALRKLLGNRRAPQTWASEIEAGLRLAFDWEAMKGTAIYACLRKWEQENNPYRIVPAKLTALLGKRPVPAARNRLAVNDAGARAAAWRAPRRSAENGR